MSSALETTAARVQLETRNFFANESFSKIEPRLQIAHDSSSIKNGKKCWRYYKYSMLDGWRAPGDDTHLFFGWLLHAGTELYDHLRAGTQGDETLETQLLSYGLSEKLITRAVSGLSHEEALLAVMRFGLVETWVPGGLSGEKPHVWESTASEKTRFTLLRLFVWYLDQHKDDNLKAVKLHNGRAAVEVSFRLFPNDMSAMDDFIAPTGEEYVFCGHIDKVVEWQDGLWITDKKTTKFALDDNYFKQFTPDVQVSMYSLAGNVIFEKPIEGFIIDGIQTLATGARFRRKTIERTPEQLNEFVRNTAAYLRELERNVREDYWPMNEEACGWGARQCQFRPICSKDPSVREDWLEALYVKRSWDPIKPR